MTPIEATQADIDRFFSYVEKLPNGCWFWTGARSRGKGNKKWYGSFRVGRRVVRAHAFASDVIAQRGPVPKGFQRDHTCKFSLCVCCEHIEVVPAAVNTARRWAGRRANDPRGQSQSEGEASPGLAA